MSHLGSPPAAPAHALPFIGPRTALFLDFDGTLVDIAAQPEAVQVPPDLRQTLEALRARLNGALAIVSGRPLIDLDGFLEPLQLPTAAEHGAQRRLAGGKITRLASPDLHAVIRQVTALAQRDPGLRVEVKSAGVALHYRHAPELAPVCLQAMTELVSTAPGLELLHGKCVLEIKPVGIDKGAAIADFMAQTPFAGRMPLFAGDDMTDETGFAVVQQRGGCGIKVGEGATGALCRCASPAALRQWLQLACQKPALPPAPGPIQTGDQP